MWAGFVINWIGVIVFLLGLALGRRLTAIGSVILVGGGALTGLLSGLVCWVLLLGWLWLIHADVRDATGDRHAMSPALAVWPMCAPVVNLFWLQRTLAKLATTIWGGCRAVGAPCDDLRGQRRRIVAMMSCLLACLGLLVIGVLVYLNLVGLANPVAALFVGSVCLWAAGPAFLAASILLMIVAHRLSRDVDRLARSRRQIDPNAVVPVDEAIAEPVLGGRL